MRQTKLTTQTLALAALLALGATASAQAGSYSASDGQLRQGGRVEELRSITLNLDRDGDFRLSLSGDRRQAINGRWSARSNNTISLTARSGLGLDSISGNGSGTLASNGRLTRLDLDGRSGNSDYRITVGSQGGWRQDDVFGRGSSNGRWDNQDDRDDWSRTREMRTSETGNGMLKWEGRRDRRITRTTVNLERDGDALIRFEGSGFSESFQGKWTGGRSNVVDIRIREGLGRSDAKADGKIVLDGRRSFRVVTLKGTQNRSRDTFSATFNSNSNRGGNWPDDREDRIAGRYEDIERWNSGRQTYAIRYDLVLEADGDAVFFIDADRDIEESRENVRNYGQILRHVNRMGDARMSGKWRVSGERIVVDLGPTSIDGRRISTTLKGHLVGRSIVFDEFNRDLFGREVDFSFERD